MLRMLMYIIAIIFPWLAMLLCDNPGGAAITLLMQATIIGWIPASSWAWRVVTQHYKEKARGA